jgi:hypothetical protein
LSSYADQILASYPGHRRGCRLISKLRGCGSELARHAAARYRLAGSFFTQQ